MTMDCWTILAIAAVGLSLAFLSYRKRHVPQTANSEQPCQQIPRSEILAFLQAIDSEIITLSTARNSGEVYSGIMTFQASNGWQISIFNDCNEWDYIDSIVSDDGRMVNYPGLCNECPELGAYAPSDAIQHRQYRFIETPEKHINHAEGV